uniref:Mitochondrial ribosomal protein L49 n=1 Tax=Mus musculus TaxID=10090 RepID=A0A494B993_MOUSE
MAAAVLRAALQDWRSCLGRSYGRRKLILFPACPTLFVALGCTIFLSTRRSHTATDR